MISSTAEYALRAVVCLASRSGQSLTIRQVADVTRIPAGYLAKVLALLARAEIVVSQRGLNGGFIFARDAATLSILDVVQVVDPSRRIAACPLKLPEHREQLCPLHRRLDQAAALAESALADSTIADILADPSPTIPLGVLDASPANDERSRPCST